MPFAVSHAAAVLPRVGGLERRARPRRALVIGWMVPDVPWFFTGGRSAALTHSPEGVVTVNLAVGRSLASGARGLEGSTARTDTAGARHGAHDVTGRARRGLGRGVLSGAVAGAVAGVTALTRWASTLETALFAAVTRGWAAALTVLTVTALLWHVRRLAAPGASALADDEPG